MDDVAEKLARNFLAGPALAVALTETVRDYIQEVERGQIQYPAHRRENANVLDLWTDIRIEALHQLFNFGLSDPFLLADPFRQEELLASFLDDKPHLEFPQPHGDAVSDTIQAMFRTYQFLDAAGTEVGDRQTDRESLTLDGRFILDTIEADCARTRQEWEAFRAAGAERPTITMMELIYSDVTNKTKSISLSKIFGPLYESGIKHCETQLADRPDELESFRKSLQRILAAQDPDHLASG